MKRSKWNSPQSMRKRHIHCIRNEASGLGYYMPEEKIDTEYTDGKLIANAELLLKDAVNASVTRDLSVTAKTYSEFKHGVFVPYTSNTRDYGMGTEEDYKVPDGWNLPPKIEIYNQRDRLTKAAALILMEIARLDRMGVDGRNLGYDIFNPTARADKKLADEAVAKQAAKQRKQEMLDIYNQLSQTADQNPTYGSANVTASSQPQFTGTIQPVPKAVPCPVH